MESLLVGVQISLVGDWVAPLLEDLNGPVAQPTDNFDFLLVVVRVGQVGVRVGRLGVEIDRLGAEVGQLGVPVGVVPRL